VLCAVCCAARGAWPAHHHRSGVRVSPPASPHAEGQRLCGRASTALLVVAGVGRRRAVIEPRSPTRASCRGGHHGDPSLPEAERGVSSRLPTHEWARSINRLGTRTGATPRSPPPLPNCRGAGRMRPSGVRSIISQMCPIVHHCRGDCRAIASHVRWTHAQTQTIQTSMPAAAISWVPTPKFTATGGPDEAAMGKRLLWTIHANQCWERARLEPDGNSPRGGGTDSQHSPPRTARCLFISV
jgi:hypothetical protein